MHSLELCLIVCFENPLMRGMPDRLSYRVFELSSSAHAQRPRVRATSASREAPSGRIVGAVSSRTDPVGRARSSTPASRLEQQRARRENESESVGTSSASSSEKGFLDEFFDFWWSFRT
jgi:hypothetical protein